MAVNIIQEETEPSQREKLLRGLKKFNGRIGFTIDALGKEIFIGILVSKVEPHTVYKKQEKTLTVPVGKMKVFNY